MNNKNKHTGGIILSIILIILAVLFFSPGLFSTLLPEHIVNPWSELIANTFGKSEGFALTPGQVIASVAVILFSAAVAFLLKTILEAIHFKKQRSETIKSVVAKLLFFIIILIGFIVGLRCLGIDVTAILIGIGIVGIVVGFGAQSLVQDLITGLFMVAEQDFKIGDIITIDDFRGEVKSIGLRSVSMQDGGGNLRIINYSEIGQIVNLSAVESTAVVRVPVSYKDALETVEGAVHKALQPLPEANPEIFKQAPVYKGVDDLGESTITLLVTASVNEPDVFEARRLIQRSIRLAFEEAGLQPPTEA